MLSKSTETAIDLGWKSGVADISSGPAWRNDSLGADEKTVALTWKDVKYQVKGKGNDWKEIIHSVSGSVRPGEMLAIMGGSGAGKSTLLDILAHRKSSGKVEGTIAFNGSDASNISALLRRISGYVTQEDVFLATVTVRENLDYFAKLTLESSTREERRQAVDNVMKELNIEHLADSKIGAVTDGRGLSGGEKKRLAIAEQLLRNPLVLFLDEPTSGLDAYNSQSVMQLLRRLGETRQMTIVASIHQPRSSIYELFDRLLILDHGNTAFFGDAASAADYFAKLGYELPRGYNPADYFVDVVLSRENKEHDFAAAYKNSQEALVIQQTVEANLSGNTLKPLSKRDAPKYAASYATQFVGLYGRWGRDLLRNPQAAVISLVQAAVVGTIVGSIFYQLGYTPPELFSRAGLLFFSLLAGAFPITSVAVLMTQNRAIVNREWASGVFALVPFWLARTLLDVPVHIVLPIIFNSIAYWMAGLNPAADRFFILLGVAILNCLVAGSLYTLIGALSPDPLVANVGSFTLTTLLMLFGGFFAVVPIYWVWLEYVSFIRWGFVALMVNEFSGTPAGEATLAQFNLQGYSVWQGVAGLACQFLIYRGLALLALNFVNREKR